MCFRCEEIWVLFGRDQAAGFLVLLICERRMGSTCFMAVQNLLKLLRTSPSSPPYSRNQKGTGPIDFTSKIDLSGGMM